MLPSAAVRVLPTPSVADGTGGHASRSGARSNELLLPGIARLLPTPRATDGVGGTDPLTRPERMDDIGTRVVRIQSLLPTPSAAECTGGGQHPDKRVGHSRQLIDFALLHGEPRWGEYTMAIEQQEAITRPAPPPTEPNTKGNPRLSARFSEWLMMWPDGWVTDPALGLSRNNQLKLIGNGVVPNQAIAAFTTLLSVIKETR